jgi:hypothetical protein
MHSMDTHRNDIAEIRRELQVGFARIDERFAKIDERFAAPTAEWKRCRPAWSG